MEKKIKGVPLVREARISIATNKLTRVSLTANKTARISLARNKKGDVGETLTDNLVYMILYILFLAAIVAIVIVPRNGSGIWAQYYASEIGKVIDSSSAGETITLNVQKATEIAQSNGVPNDEIFSFDNVGNAVKVKLAPGSVTEFRFYNNVDVLDWKVVPGLYQGSFNTLQFKVVGAQK